jgi:hypothetical protein
MQTRKEHAGQKNYQSEGNILKHSVTEGRLKMVYKTFPIQAFRDDVLAPAFQNS